MNDRELIDEALRVVAEDEEVAERLRATGGGARASWALEAELVESTDISQLNVSDELGNLKGAEDALDEAKRVAIERLAAEDPDVGAELDELRNELDERSKLVEELLARETRERADIERMRGEREARSNVGPLAADEPPSSVVRRLLRRRRGQGTQAVLEAREYAYQKAIEQLQYTKANIASAMSDRRRVQRVTAELMQRLETNIHGSGSFPEVAEADRVVTAARAAAVTAVARYMRGAALARLSEPLAWQSRWRRRAEALPEVRADEAVSAEQVDSRPAVFRAFDLAEFRAWPTWERLLGVLKSNGGSYGLSGARGAGKSWLMMAAIEWARADDSASELGGIGLWYPTPSEYDALAFLASLTDSFAIEVDRWFRRSPTVRRQKVAKLRALISLTVAGLIAGGVVVWLASRMKAIWVVAITAGWLAGVLLGAAILFRPLVLRLRREAQLAREAKVVQERARYAAKHTDYREFGAEGSRGLAARAKLARTRELVERPATLSSLVNDFRALAAEAGEVAGRVVVAIDELDKMSDVEKVRALLRDIKGIFEVRNVHFLVSVSDEAARSLSLGALTGRDEFNSSFYTVIEVPPASPDALAELLEQRSETRIPREVALALGALAGGNPRETLRLADLAGTSLGRGDAVLRAVADEALRLRREVVTAMSSDSEAAITAEDRVNTFTALPDVAFSSGDELAQLTRDGLSDTMWEPPWQSPAFVTRFGEAWKRLMIRLVVARDLAASDSLVREPDLMDRLRDVIVVATQSADVARIVLQRHLRVDSPGHGLEQQEARDRLRQVARRYEELRSSESSSDKRTAALERLIGEARMVARDSGLTAEELADLLLSEAPGDRLVALAVVEATGEPASFESVLAMATQAESPFEQYHALLALETLLPTLSSRQRVRVSNELPAEIGDGVGETERDVVAARIQAALSMGEDVSPRRPQR